MLPFSSLRRASWFRTLQGAEGADCIGKVKATDLEARVRPTDGYVVNTEVGLSGIAAPAEDAHHGGEDSYEAAGCTVESVACSRRMASERLKPSIGRRTNSICGRCPTNAEVGATVIEAPAGDAHHEGEDSDEINAVLSGKVLDKEFGHVRTEHADRYEDTVGNPLGTSSLNAVDCILEAAVPPCMAAPRRRTATTTARTRWTTSGGRRGQARRGAGGP